MDAVVPFYRELRLLFRAGAVDSRIIVDSAGNSWLLAVWKQPNTLLVCDLQAFRLPSRLITKLHQVLLLSVGHEKQTEHKFK